MTMLSVTSIELVLDAIYPYFDMVYKLIRPSLILTRVILDAISYMWPWRRSFRNNRPHQVV